ncbi:hypothetical protein [Paenibacillus lignilyticus]|uniref:Uncharacterized protein n=1 Tax=Paenibacillus lignilyticus TaxID=1172615 RepID=A0ABS5CL02_9BACL|nr:hypothetical protein [Paenibacillus lignilyticus]MBP3966544.1 hypothetical protein [Paenibacillus lignilyticus]
MKFHLKKTIIITLVVYPIFLFILYLMAGFVIEAFVLFSGIFLFFMIFQLGYYWVIEGEKISKYIFFMKHVDIEISEIKLIEAYKVKEIGTIHFYLGKGPHEDEYQFIMKNGLIIKSYAHCYNSNGLTIGRYLNNEKRIKLIEKTRYKIMNS